MVIRYKKSWFPGAACIDWRMLAARIRVPNGSVFSEMQAEERRQNANELCRACDSLESTPVHRPRFVAFQRSVESSETQRCEPSGRRQLQSAPSRPGSALLTGPT